MESVSSTVALQASLNEFKTNKINIEVPIPPIIWQSRLGAYEMKLTFETKKHPNFCVSLPKKLAVFSKGILDKRISNRGQQGNTLCNGSNLAPDATWENNHLLLVS